MCKYFVRLFCVRFLVLIWLWEITLIFKSPPSLPHYYLCELMSPLFAAIIEACPMPWLENPRVGVAFCSPSSQPLMEKSGRHQRGCNTVFQSLYNTTLFPIAPIFMFWYMWIFSLFGCWVVGDLFLFVWLQICFGEVRV